MKTLKLAFTSLLLITSLHLFAQYEYPGEAEEKAKRSGPYRNSNWFFGADIGGFGGFLFGDYTYIELSPIAGYKVSPRFSVGGGPMYTYKNSKGLYETSIYGCKIFSQFIVLKDIKKTTNINIGDILFYAESQILNIEPIYIIYYNPGQYDIIKESRKWINISLIGFGMKYPLGYRSGVSILILWDINQNPEYYYSNPEIRFSFSF